MYGLVVRLQHRLVLVVDLHMVGCCVGFCSEWVVLLHWYGGGGGGGEWEVIKIAPLDNHHAPV